MSVIEVRARLLTWDEYITNQEVGYAGSFQTDTSDYWDVTVTDQLIRPGAPDMPGTSWQARVWLTRSGRWIYTVKGDARVLTLQQARAILIASDRAGVVREHIDRVRNREGRPEIGPEVKTRLPLSAIAAVDRLADANGVSRAAQLRALVLDALPAEAWREGVDAFDVVTKDPYLGYEDDDQGLALQSDGEWIADLDSVDQALPIIAERLGIGPAMIRPVPADCPTANPRWTFTTEG